MLGRNVLLALVAALAVALIWSLAGLSAGLGQALAALAAFALVWLALARLPSRDARQPAVDTPVAATARPDPVPPEQRELLSKVTSALADQQRAFDDAETQLRTLRSAEARLLEQPQGSDQELTAKYRLATIRSQIEQLERLVGVIATNIVALQTQRGAVHTAVAAHIMPTPSMVLEIQSQLQRAQHSLALADESTRSLQELTEDVSLDRADLIGDLVRDPAGEQTPARRRQPATPLAVPEA